MKVLVTGGSGFIGSHIVDVLIEDGNVVTNLDLVEPHRWDLNYISGSIMNRSLIDSLVEQCDVIFHIGGFSNVDLVQSNPVETVELNVNSTLYLLDACRRFGNKHLLYASSVYVGSNQGHLYTTSKLMSERLIENFGSLYNFTYTILRFASVYGTRSRKVDAIYSFVEKALRGDNIIIHGDGSQSRNFTYVRDVAEASVHAMHCDMTKNKLRTIADPISHTVCEVAEKVRNLIDSKCEIVYEPSFRHKDYSGKFDDISESLNLLGWKPRIPLENGIYHLVDEIESSSIIS